MLQQKYKKIFYKYIDSFRIDKRNITGIFNKNSSVISSIVMCLKFIPVFVFIIILTGCGLPHNKRKEREKIVSQGAAVYSKYGCMACHSLDGDVLYGPPLNDIFMKEIKVLRKGEVTTVIVNREYLKKAITEPRFEKVLEYINKEMPLTFLSEEEVDILVEYIVEMNRKIP